MSAQTAVRRDVLRELRHTVKEYIEKRVLPGAKLIMSPNLWPGIDELIVVPTYLRQTVRLRRCMELFVVGPICPK